MTGMPLNPPDTLDQEVILECLGGPPDGEWLTHDSRVFTCTRPSLRGQGPVASVYQLSPRATPRGLSFVWLYLGDR